MDSLDEINDDLADDLRYDGGWGALDISKIDGGLEIDGEDVEIDFGQIDKHEAVEENSWEEFRDKVGVYFAEIDDSECTATFDIHGDFDPKKLWITLWKSDLSLRSKDVKKPVKKKPMTKKKSKAKNAANKSLGEI